MLTKKEWAALVILALFAMASYLTGVDYLLAKTLSNRTSHGISLFFSEWYFLAYMLVASAMLLKRDRKALMTLVASVAIIFLIQLAFTKFAPRERPAEAMPIGDGLMKLIRESGASSSFPSGHTASVAAVFALFLLIGFHPAASFLLGLPIAVSRILLVQHYLSDVLGGAIIGYVIAKSVYSLVRRCES
jgi:undecaprenyl-diphosphatase